MCLEEIKERYKVKDNKCGWGYKIVRKNTTLDGIIHFRPQYQGNANTLEEKKWLHEKKYRSRYMVYKYLKTHQWPETSIKYPYGFHILLATKKKLLEKVEYKWVEGYFHNNYRIVRVKYRYAQTLGIDQSYKSFITIVAKEIFIVSNKKGE